MSNRTYLEFCKKNPDSKIIERFSNDGTFDLSTTKIGTLKTITQNMEVSFEMKIQNMDSFDVDNYNDVLWIEGWFYFDISKSFEESNFYIYHEQRNGLGHHNYIQKESPISFSNSWKKEFLLKF